MTSNPFQRLRFTLGLAILLLCVGVLGFHLIGGLAPLDALYMAVTTMSTVGYREVGGEPDTPTKLFTICFILSGVGVLFYAASVVMEVALDERTRHFFRMRTNTRKARVMNNHSIICGLGRVGRAVAEELSRSNEPFVVVDNDPERLALASNRGWTCVQGDASEDNTLQQVNVSSARALFACVDTDTTNLFIVISAKGVNASMEISARVVDERNFDKFRRAGASHVYSPYSLLGRRMARSVTRPRAMELLDLALEQTGYDLTVDECRIPEGSRMHGMSLAESEFRNKTGCVILAIIRSSGEIFHNPSPSAKLNTGDVLVTLGTPQQLERARIELAPGPRPK